jgi:gliding motility-associated-like protein
MKKNTFFSLSFNRIFTLFFLFSLSSSFAQTVYYVNSSTGNDANAGTIAAPYKTFHKAYTIAASGDTINLTGTFDWTAVDELGDASTTGYTLAKSLTIQGQGAGSTFIQAASSRNTADRRVFTLSGGYAITIKNLTIRHGKVGASQSGGGIVINSSSQVINLENLIIEKNDAASSGYNYGGGGIAVFNSNSTADITISNCDISNNATNAWGGGIYTSGTSGTSANKTVLTNSTISNNVAGENGSAIGAYYGRNFVMINSTVSGNTGASTIIFSNHSTGSAFFLNNTIAYNTATSSWGNSVYLEFVNSATFQNNIIVETRTSSNVLVGHITQRQNIPLYKNNIIDFIPTNWAASNDVQNGVNGNIVGTNLALGLSNTLGLNSSTGITNTLPISCASVATNAGSNTDYGYAVPATDQRGVSRNGNVDIGSFENQGVSEIAYNGNLTAFSKCGTSPSSNQSFTVLGCNLTENISISAPAGFEISTNASTGFASSLTLTQSGGTVASTTIFIRMTAAATGSPSGNISLTSTGATTQTVALTGTVNALPTITGTLSINAGSTSQLTGSGTANGLTPWVSSNTAVATVSSTGLVSAVSAGTTTITYTANTGCSITATVTVAGQIVVEYRFNNSLAPSIGTGSATIANPGTLGTTATLSASNICTDNVSTTGSLQTPNLTFNIAAFQVDLDFSLPVLPSSLSYLLNLSATSRAFGVQVGPTGRLNVYYATPTTNDISTQSTNLQLVANTNYNLSLQYVSNSIRLMVNGNLVLVVDVPGGIATPSNRSFMFGDAPSTTASMSVCVDNFRIITNPQQFTFSDQLVVNPTSFSAFNSCVNNSSAVQTFTVSATNLSDNTVVVRRPVSNYEISLDGTNYSNSTIVLTAVSGTLNTTTLYIRSISTATSGAIAAFPPKLLNVDVSNSTYPIYRQSFPLIGTVFATPVISGSNSISVGGSTTLTATTTPAASSPWISSDVNIATVNSSGVVTGVALGTATVTYTNAGGCQSTFTVTVAPPTITTSGILNAFTKCFGSSSTPQSFTVSGVNMSAGITVNALDGFEYSLTSNGTYTTTLTVGAAGTIASTSVFVRMQSSANNANYSSANISLTSTGATPIDMAVTGSTTTLNTGTASSNQVLCDATNASDVVLTGSSGTIQWQRSSDNSTWENISSATNATLTSAQIGTVNSTTYIRAQVTSGSCIGNSNTVVLRVNNALAFDGTGDFVPLGTNAALNLMSNLTVEAWVYVPASPKSSINTIFSKNYTNLGNPGYMFGFNNWNTTDLKITFEDGSSAYSSNTTLTSGAWNHAAVVISGNGTIGNFYINGSPAGSFSATLTNASAVAEFIGAMDSSGSYSLKGTLDELRIWNVARTQQEIIDNMDNSLIGSETGLVAYYDFDQGIPGGTNTAITSVLNKTSNALNGTFTGISKTGTSSNFVSSTITNFSISGVATICANSTSQYTHPIAGGSWSVSNGATATINSSSGLLTTTVGEILTINYTYIMSGCSKTDTLIVTVNNPATPVATTTINLCQSTSALALTATALSGHTLQWYTAATGGTASTTAPTPLTNTVGSTIYYVSQKSNTTNCEGARTAITVNVNAIPTISGVQNMAVGGTTLQLTGSGTPASVTPWISSNPAAATISSTGLVSAVNTGSTTITYTTAEGCSVTAIINILNCASPFGNAMSFDADNDYVVVGDTFENLADLTTEAWVYWRGSNNAYSEIFTKDLVSAFSITSTNKLHANFGNGSTWDSGLNSSASIPLNTWTHLAVTRQSGVVKLYINGIQDTSTSTLSLTGQNSTHRAIGAKLTGTTLYANSVINGKIDEVRFWSSARTQAQIQSGMNTELAGTESGLLAYYNFNHGIAGGNNASVNTVVNLVNSASNGTLTNFTKSGSTSNFVVGVTSNFSITGASTICVNSTSQYTHPIAGGTWSLSNGANATINSSTGLLTTTVGETLSISYSYTMNGCSYTDTKSVTIQLPVISGTSTIGVGDQITLTATTTPSSSNAWVSSNTNVATITNAGVISGLALGTTTITYINAISCTASQTITVTAGTTQSPVLTSPSANTTGATTLNISYTLPETPLAGSVRLTFTPTAGGTPIVWTMTNATSVTFSHAVGTNPLVANPNNVLSGGVLSFATYNITLSYQDANGNPVAQVTNANIQTLAPPSISFSNASYQGIINTSLTAITPINSGGTSTYSISPSLPNGVSINTTTGVISGIPTVAITARQYTLTATNAAGSSTATFTLFIDIDTDGDGIGDATDSDIDGDGVPNNVEQQQGTSLTNPTDVQDTDGDGVPDYVEQQQGTNPTNPTDSQDTDGDGVPDYVEQQQGTSPTTPGAQDTDGDGVPDYVEQQQGTSPTRPGAQDTDGDGVSDYVEQQQGTSPTIPGDTLLDTDGDGVPDYVEQQQGTNPTNPTDSQDTDGDGVPDYVEQQQGTSLTTPGARDTDGDGVPDYVEQQQGTSPTTSGAQDTDDDGVPDYVEQQQGTNPTTPGDTLLDTDGDGVPDYVEQQQGTNPTNPTDSQDTDGDGVPDYVEQQQGTSPTIPGARDTDGDGVPDYVEQQQGTSPTTPGARDTDGDGVPDYIEQQQGTSPTTPGDTLLDTDGDGVPDYVEQQQGTSPTTPGARDTDGDGVPDYVEQQQGTSPTIPGARDTDGDGVPDYVEQQQGTSPTTPGARDIDGDGVPDYVEQQQGTSPTTPGNILLDTDGDGVPNYVELQQGSNPLVVDVPDSDNDGISDYKEGYNYSNPGGSTDTDLDGIPNYLDRDADGDGILDGNDAYPINKSEWTDSDRDGTGNNTDTDDDNDGILDACDVDTNGDGIPDNGIDMDGDGIIDSCDPDIDGDGVNNTNDNCPNSPNPNQADRDGDGQGDVCDTIELNTMQALTPNGDGINDTWVIYNLVNHPHSTVRVFNSNGVQVYYSSNYQNNWAGSYQGSGEMLPTGSYLYQVDLGGDGSIDEQGWIYITK